MSKAVVEKPEKCVTNHCLVLECNEIHITQDYHRVNQILQVKCLTAFLVYTKCLINVDCNLLSIVLLEWKALTMH